MSAPTVDERPASLTREDAERAARGGLGPVEFTSLLAMSMALAALGIDLMLPAFGDIRTSLGLPSDSTAVAGLVTAYFLGLAGGQLLYGPIADRFGRRRALQIGYSVYALGALLAAVAPTLQLLFLARVVWGLGAAGPRVVTLAVVRDVYEGERMSRAMSFIMAVFILVPVIAPTIGALISSVASWRWLFGVCVIAVVSMAVWAGLRLPETLSEEDRLPLQFGRLARAAREVVSHRRTAGYTLAMTALYGVFTSYIGSSELIFGDVFGQAETFPIIFGGLAALLGGAMLVNARIVERVGTYRLVHMVLVGYVIAAVALVVMVAATGGTPPLWAFLIGLGVMLSAHALLIPNFNTIAMQPMGKIAGTASSIIGAVQLAIGALLGALLDRAFDGTVLPISLGFLGFGIVAVAIVLWVERGRLFSPPADTVADGATAEPEGARAA